MTYLPHRKGFLKYRVEGRRSNVWRRRHIVKANRMRWKTNYFVRFILSTGLFGIWGFAARQKVLLTCSDVRLKGNVFGNCVMVVTDGMCLFVLRVF